MASSIKVPSKRLSSELDNSNNTSNNNDNSAPFAQLENKKPKYGLHQHNNSLSSNESEDASNIGAISSYNTPPPSTVSDSRDRSLSPNEDKAQPGISTTQASTEKPISEEGEKLLSNDFRYISLCSTLSLLRSQREMVRKDIVKLRDLKLKLCQDPLRFIEELSKNQGEIVNAIPKKVKIINGDVGKMFKK